MWQLNFKDKLKEKGLDFEEDFVVMEVCNPKKAKEVMGKNIHIGYVLPCKMVIREKIIRIMIAKNNRQKKRPIESSSLEILNERYARGEIDDQEYSRRNKNLDL
ncbi:DUF302 domain-containing protein [Tetragenococcus halophilus]|uniref:DUF302 domain-containing protein n=1 Tax=Tetragenococcus halophilus TaxID=51669 RepID=UPI00209A8A3A|nr:DUF302 domain-containing protein [Tetragenococcus halophilus]